MNKVVLWYTYIGCLLALLAVVFTIIWVFCFKKRRKFHKFATIQLTLLLINELTFNYYFIWCYEPKEEGYNQDDVVCKISIDLSNFSFILQHWLYIYQYLRVANLLPLYLTLNQTDTVLQMRKRTQFQLQFIFWIFIVITLIYSISYAATKDNQLVTLTQNLLLLSETIVLIYSMCKL